MRHRGNFAQHVITLCGKRVRHPGDTAQHIITLCGKPERKFYTTNSRRACFCQLSESNTPARTHANRHFPGHFVVHMRRCLRVLFCVAHPLHTHSVWTQEMRSVWKRSNLGNFMHWTEQRETRSVRKRSNLGNVMHWTRETRSVRKRSNPGNFSALDTGNAVSSETVQSGKFSARDTGNAVNSETVQSGNRSLKTIQGHWLKIIQLSSPEGNKCDLPACPPPR